MHAQLHEDVLNVAARRVNRNVEQGCYPFVGPSLRQELCDCEFAWRQVEAGSEAVVGPAPGCGTLERHDGHRTAAEHSWTDERAAHLVRCGCGAKRVGPG